MNLIYKRFYRLFGIVCGFFLTLQAGSGTFERSFTLKPVRISVSSQNFLKQISSSLMLILSKIRSDSGNQDVKDIVQLCVEMNNLLRQKEFLTHDHHVKIQKIIELQKKCLAVKTKPVKIDVDAVSELLKETKEAFDVTNLRGFEPDGRYIKKFLSDLSEPHAELHKRRQVLDTIANISDIITHFDGVMITDYDVVVLFYTASALFLEALSVFLEVQTRLK
ncbi:MAG: hypothetical protein WC747_03545 [Candidatus Babeliales bacterium]|jgi:hypothetical protein